MDYQVDVVTSDKAAGRLVDPLMGSRHAKCTFQDIGAFVNHDRSSDAEDMIRDAMH